MMYESKKTKFSSVQKHPVKLHPEVIEILFENRRYIKNVFSNLKGLHQYYREQLFGLIDMGDYFYKSLRELYSCYSLNHEPPKSSEFNSKAIGLNIRPFLHLVRT